MTHLSKFVFLLLVAIMLPGSSQANANAVVKVALDTVMGTINLVELDGPISIYPIPEDPRYVVIAQADHDKVASCMEECGAADQIKMRRLEELNEQITRELERRSPRPNRETPGSRCCQTHPLTSLQETE